MCLQLTISPRQPGHQHPWRGGEEWLYGLGNPGGRSWAALGPPLPPLDKAQTEHKRVRAACGGLVGSRYSPLTSVILWGFQSACLFLSPWSLFLPLGLGTCYCSYLDHHFVVPLITSTFSFFRSENHLLSTAFPTHHCLMEVSTYPGTWYDLPHFPVKSVKHADCRVGLLFPLDRHLLCL